MRAGDRAAMSTASVLLATDRQEAAAPKYTLLLSTDPGLIEEAQRLRYEVFTSEPGFELTSTTDADRFDQYCDHLLVREDTTGELVGCYRMLPPPGAIAAGGPHTPTQVAVRAPHPPPPSTPPPSSTSAPSTRCGRRWSRWAGRWSERNTATARSCC